MHIQKKSEPFVYKNFKMNAYTIGIGDMRYIFLIIMISLSSIFGGRLLDKDLDGIRNSLDKCQAD